MLINTTCSKNTRKQQHQLYNFSQRADFLSDRCVSARRRRRRGRIPFRGTGWLANHGPAVYNPNAYNAAGSTTTGPTTTTTGTTTQPPQTGAAASYYASYAPPPPMYTPSTTGGAGGPTSPAYNEQQHSGIELTNPQPTYQSGGKPGVV